MEKVRSNINAMNLNVRDRFVPNKTLRRIQQSIEKSVYANAQDDKSSTAIWIEKLRSSGELIHFTYDEAGGIELAFCPALGRHCIGSGNVKLLCLDSTHKTTAYDHSLFSLVMQNGHGQGVPVAFMISSSRKTETVTRFLAALLLSWSVQTSKYS